VAVQQVLYWALQWLGARHPRVRLGDAPRFYTARLLTALLAATILLSSKRSRRRGTLALAVPDSRTAAASWLHANTPKQRCDLILPRVLRFNPITVQSLCRVHTLRMADYADVEAVAQRIEALPVSANSYVALPRWKEDAAFLSELPARLALGDTLFVAGHFFMTFDASRRIDGNPALRICAYRKP
jgi:hypothetical protein